MTSTSKRGLYRKLLILVLLSVGLGLALTDPMPAVAAPCCQTCISDQLVCENLCALQCEATTGDCYIDCWDECYYGYHGFTYCAARCVWCSYGAEAEPGSPFCDFAGPTPTSAGSVLNSVTCGNGGYSANCETDPFWGTYCCDTFGCY